MTLQLRRAFVCGALIGCLFSGKGTAEEPKPVAPSLSVTSHWNTAASASDGNKAVKDEHWEFAKERVSRGDATVIPLLRKWLSAGLPYVKAREDDMKLYVAFDGIGQFHDIDSAPLVSEYYQRAWLFGQIRKQAASSLAIIAAPDRTEELRQIMWDQYLDLETRCRAAAALVERDDDSARLFLLLQYDLYLVGLESSKHGTGMTSVCRAIETLADPKMMASLELTLMEATRITEGSIKSVLKSMYINAQSYDGLNAIASDPQWQTNIAICHSAIWTLGKKGNPDDIALLESLPRGTNATESEVRYLKEKAALAILEIRRRHSK